MILSISFYIFTILQPPPVLPSSTKFPVQVVSCYSHYWWMRGMHVRFQGHRVWVLLRSRPFPVCTGILEISSGVKRDSRLYRSFQNPVFVSSLDSPPPWITRSTTLYPHLDYQRHVQCYCRCYSGIWYPVLCYRGPSWENIHCLQEGQGYNNWWNR